MAADQIPGAWAEAATAGAGAIVGMPAALLGETTEATASDRLQVALTVLSAAFEAGAIVPRSHYDELDMRLRQANGRFDRITAQMETVGTKRAATEVLAHELAQALVSSRGGDEVLERYRSFVW